MRRTYIVAVALGLVLGRVASAQPGAPIEPEPVPPVGTTPNSPANDNAIYDQAFQQIVAGDLVNGARALDDLAARTPDPQLAARARELARLAHELIARRIRFVVDNTPSSAELETDDKVDGQTSFIVWSTMYALYGGITLVVDADIKDARAGILTVTGATAAGLFGSYFATQGRTMTGAMADAYSLGMLEGVANAALLVHPIGLDHTGKQVVTSLLVAGAFGAGVGLGYGTEVDPTRGQIAFAGTLSLLGFASAGLGLAITQPDFKDNTFLLTMTGGLDGGLAAGLWFGRDIDWSVSRGRIVQLGVLLGALTGAAAGYLVIGGGTHNSDDERIVAATTLAGLWGGFGVAVKLTGDMRRDRRYMLARSSTQLAPMPLRDGAGLAFVGSF